MKGVSAWGWVLWVGGAVAAAGCLEARRPGGLADAGADVVVGDTAVVADAVDPCDGKTCDDGDPCTLDGCDAVTGLCVHTLLTGGEPPECSDDRQCDDGDPCTADRCVLVPDDQACGGWAYCEHIRVPGQCGGCHLTGCDDGDPCTRDVCEPDGACWSVREPHCVDGCSSLGALKPSELRWSIWPGEQGKVAGRAAPGDELMCGTQCVCQTALTIADGGSGVGLVPPVEASALWGCLVDTCETPANTSCVPLTAGRAYWVWGEALDPWMTTPYRAGDKDEAGAPRPEIEQLRVADYCMQTTPRALDGRYQGHFLTEQGRHTVPFVATITTTSNGAATVRLEPRPCADCPAWLVPPGEQSVALALGDGYVELSLLAPSWCDGGPAQAKARLFSQRDRLVGRYHDPWFDHGLWDAAQRRADPDEDVAWCALGTLVLEREP